MDDDPLIPNAVAGVFHDARQVGRVVQAFTVSISGAPDGHSIDEATELAVETLSQRSDIDSSVGSITLLMEGEMAGVIVALPHGAPPLKKLGEVLVDALSERFGTAQVAVGMATTRDHKELELDDALAVAIEGLEVARASGSNRAVHSELYELTLSTRRRQGTVFPLEAVRQGQLKGPAEETTDYILQPAESPASKAGPNASSAEAEVLGELDDPFAHLASEAYELNQESALALTNGIAPKAGEAAEFEKQSRIEIERLRMELDVARRDQLESKGNEKAANIQERRIAKLLQQLEVAEAEIARLHQNRERGVGSAYRSVQGLDPNEPAAKKKRVLIDGVFESNKDDAVQ